MGAAVCPVVGVDAGAAGEAWLTAEGEEQVCGLGDTQAERQTQPCLAGCRASWCLLLGAQLVLMVGGGGASRRPTAGADPPQ